MTDILDKVQAQIADQFSPEQVRRARDWAQSPEGRRALQEQAAELRKLATPIPWDSRPVHGEEL